MKYIISLFLLLIISCQSSTDIDDQYFSDLNREVSSPTKNGIHQLDKTKALYKRELKKYQQTGEHKFLISSKYAEIFLYVAPEDRAKLIPLVYNLLILNNDQSPYISVACNFNLASQFETTSPDLSLHFLNKAISLDEKGGKKFFLPHLYHVKGRWYYNKQDYSKALYYFNKALKTYSPSDVLYIASMHNNFGMCYNKMNKMDRAIEEVSKASQILEAKTNLSDGERYYIYFFKEYLGEYLLKIKDYKNAEKIFIQELNFFKNKKTYYGDVIKTSNQLFALYTATNENHKMKDLYNLLILTEPNLKDLPEKIAANKLIENYYLDTNDLPNLKIISKKLSDLDIQNNKASDLYLTMITGQFSEYTIKNIDQKYGYRLTNENKKIWLLLIFIFFSVLTYYLVLISIRNNNKRENAIHEKEKFILETNKKILEQDIDIKNNKIENLHLNLNLMVETEKVFLENLKKINKSKNVNPEELLQDLFFKINNLIQMSNKSNDLKNENSVEMKLFIDKLNETFPFLTEQEKKLCTYFKLGLSSKEVSLLEDITDGSARVYKARIKSKMKLDKDTDLNQFLNTL